MDTFSSLKFFSEIPVYPLPSPSLLRFSISVHSVMFSVHNHTFIHNALDWVHFTFHIIPYIPDSVIPLFRISTPLIFSRDLVRSSPPLNHMILFLFLILCSVFLPLQNHAISLIILPSINILIQLRIQHLDYCMLFTVTLSDLCPVPSDPPTLQHTFTQTGCMHYSAPKLVPIEKRKV